VARSSADPVDLGVQNDLIGLLVPMSIEAVLAAQNGGYSSRSDGLELAQAERTAAGWSGWCFCR
jgi:hypothetical protein